MKLVKASALPALALALTALPALAGCSNNPAAPGSPTPSATVTAPTTSPTTATSPPTVVYSQVTYPWHWPNDVTKPLDVRHTNPVPPVPELTAIHVGDHPASQGDRAYNRMSFTFTTGFPSYRVQFVSSLTADPSGRVIPLEGNGVLLVTFRGAQAHTDAGASSVTVQPAAHLGLARMASWAQAGDFEAVVHYGIGISWPASQSNPQLAVRAVEVETVGADGQHLYTVAIDVDATP